MPLFAKSVFVTCRTKSTRLPNKALLELPNGMKVIEYILGRAKLVGRDYPVILCTTLDESDDLLASIAQKEGVFCFRGSTEDKLDRWLKAAQKFNVEHFATFDADDLFCSPDLIRSYLESSHASRFDLTRSSSVVPGIFTYGIKVSALKKVCESKKSLKTEMMWEFFERDPELNIGELENVPENFCRANLRFTLDYKEDFDFFLEIFRNLGCKVELSLDHILRFLENSPEVGRINLQRQMDYLSNQARIIEEERKS
jgi:spore coat polysaccharide biosynthesis protein SpsF (cytidylyltransferase family)